LNFKDIQTPGYLQFFELYSSLSTPCIKRAVPLLTAREPERQTQQRSCSILTADQQPQHTSCADKANHMKQLICKTF